MLWLSAYVCLLLTAYYVLKPVREALILAEPNGAELKSYASLGQVLMLSLIVPGYSWLVNRLPRGKLIRTVSFVFIACLLGFYALVRAHAPNVGLAFFLWVGVFNLMVIAQFWAFASDLYTREQGERLFAILTLGASLGAILGSQVTGMLVGSLGVPQMLLVGAAVLLVSLGVSQKAEQAAVRAAPSETDSPASERVDAPPERSPALHGGFQLVFESRYLLLLGLLMLVSNVVNTTGEFLLGSYVKARALEVTSGEGVKTFVGAFYADFFLITNIASTCIQLFVTPRLLRYVGVRGALLVLPSFALFGYVGLVALPTLAAARWAKTAENSLDYSLNNTVRNALFLPLSREQKYKAKQVVDTVFVRAGDVMSAALVFVGLNWLHWTLPMFALGNLAFVAVWLLLAVRLGKAYEAFGAARTPQ